MGWADRPVDVFSSGVGTSQLDRLPPCLGRPGGLLGAPSPKLFPVWVMTSIPIAN